MASKVFVVYTTVLLFIAVANIESRPSQNETTATTTTTTTPRTNDDQSDSISRVGFFLISVGGVCLVVALVTIIAVIRRNLIHMLKKYLKR